MILIWIKFQNCWFQKDKEQKFRMKLFLVSIRTPKWVWDRSPLVVCWFTKESLQESITFFRKLQQIQEYKDGTERRFKENVMVETSSERGDAMLASSFPFCKGGMVSAPFCFKHRERGYTQRAWDIVLPSGDTRLLSDSCIRKLYQA